MPTLADLFETCYLTGGSGVEFSAIRLHCRGVDEICRAFGATALTVGTDIYFRREAFAPHTPEGLRLLAHEVAHVVQQHRRPVTAGPAEEREADAAADALLRGRRFDFGAAGFPAAPSGPDRCVVQRYMAWEHCMLGDLDPARLGAEHLDAQCALLERLGRDPRDVDEERLRAEHPGAQTLRLASWRSRGYFSEPAAPPQRIHVEQDGTLVALRQWHDSSLRDLCFSELFSLWRTSATRILASAVCRRFGVPSPDIEALRNG